MSMKSAIIAPLRRTAAAFTLAELLVSVSVVVIIIVIVSQLKSTAGQDAARYGRLEHMSKGLLWNGVSNNTGNGNNVYYPIVFQTGQIDASCTGNSCPCNGTVGPWANAWSAAICNTNNSSEPDY